MASKALLRRRKFVSDYLNASYRPIQSFQILRHENTFQNLESPAPHPNIESACTNVNHISAPNGTSVTKGKLWELSGIGQFTTRYYGSMALGFGNGRSEYTSPLGIRWISQSIRNASTAAAKQQELGSDNEENEELVSKKRKEASPEECDQAVEGLSTAKAKAKAKKLQEQKVANSILRRVWTTFLGIGPALKAVASMSKLDSLSA